MSIIGVLSTLVLLAMGSIQKNAKDKATRALVERLNLHISDYYRITGKLPEDGFDTQVEVEGRRDGRFKGSAALYYQLTHEVKEVTIIAGETLEENHEAVADFPSGNLQKDGEDSDIVYIIDGHGERIHYDNLSVREDAPANDEGDPDSSHGRFQFTAGYDSHYEIWSIGMRAAQEEQEGERKEREAREDEGSYDF